MGLLRCILDCQLTPSVFPRNCCIIWGREPNTWWQLSLPFHVSVDFFGVDFVPVHFLTYPERIISIRNCSEIDHDCPWFPQVSSFVFRVTVCASDIKKEITFFEHFQVQFWNRCNSAVSLLEWKNLCWFLIWKQRKKENLFRQFFPCLSSSKPRKDFFSFLSTSISSYLQHNGTRTRHQRLPDIFG